MKNVGIIPNLKKDNGLEFTDLVTKWLREKGCEVFLPDKARALTGFPELAVSTDELYQSSDFLVSLGGDGTMLKISHKSAIYDKPVLGINLGTLGYLTDVERDGAFTALDKVLKGEFSVEKRIMLNAKLLFSSSSRRSMEDTEKKPLIGLNDVAVSRGVFSKLLDFELRVNKEFIDTYRADGIIISTPTGSTAYNLSAGGPILRPDTEMIAITPICPHMMHSRPYVVPAGDIINIKITGSSDDVVLAIDGSHTVTMKKGEEIEISRSEYCASVIKTNTLGFYDVLRMKLVGKSEDRL